jgi:predicted nucleic acid-binding protein
MNLIAGRRISYCWLLQLDILPQVFETVFAPPAVAKEVQTPLDWLRVQAVANSSVVTALRTQMDRGEAEAIAYSRSFTVVRRELMQLGGEPSN